MDQAARGKKALDAANYEKAITEFTAALKQSPTSPDYLVKRSTAYQRAKKYTEALADANSAVLNAQKRAKRELIVEGQFRRGCAFYSLERYGDAEFVFEIVKRMDHKHKMIPTWLQKTKMALEKLGDDDEKRKCSVKETPEAEESSKEVKEDGKEAKEDGKAATNGASNADGTASAPAQTALPPAPQQHTPADKIRHEWYQNSETVYFTLLAKGVPKDKAQVDIQERSLSISFPLTTGSSFDFTLEPLFGAVKPEKCIPRILPTKIEIVLAKATPGVKWSALESSDPMPSTSTDSTTADTPENTTGNDDTVKRAVFTESKATGPAYPTSSKSGPKDWDKIVNADAGDGKGGKEDDDDDEGGDEANHFFKKLFKGSSPEVQRAMMKSYTESNGTALSTNWEEVGKAKVETSPPDGMEAKKW